MSTWGERKAVFLAANTQVMHAYDFQFWQTAAKNGSLENTFVFFFKEVGPKSFSARSYVNLFWHVKKVDVCLSLLQVRIIKVLSSKARKCLW